MQKHLEENKKCLMLWFAGVVALEGTIFVLTSMMESLGTTVMVSAMAVRFLIRSVNIMLSILMLIFCTSKLKQQINVPFWLSIAELMLGLSMIGFASSLARLWTNAEDVTKMVKIGIRYTGLGMCGGVIMTIGMTALVKKRRVLLGILMIYVIAALSIIMGCGLSFIAGVACTAAIGMVQPLVVLLPAHSNDNQLKRKKETAQTSYSYLEAYKHAHK